MFWYYFKIRKEKKEIKESIDLNKIDDGLITRVKSIKGLWAAWKLTKKLRFLIDIDWCVLMCLIGL